ncbi:MAG TPA: type IV toxin-antitoxin system AbiEi family antitoxin [Mycobacteriales bacterium]|nr:type IV toxin-antitoxin system AbiEi family antitoxin [Mycobacteriales bacterium]
MGTVRPRDVDIYTQPHLQIRRLERHGLLHRMAAGYYAVVPPDRVNTGWMPTIEGAAAGIAAADFGEDNFALMGLTAARLHRVIPRALAFAVVATPRRRKPVQMEDRTATAHFLTRDPRTIYTERMITDMGPCQVTIPEQTLLDLAHLPKLGDMEQEVWAAIDTLRPGCDQALLTEIAQTQRLGAALRRVRLRTRDA